jgi:hypothetical protein
MAQLRLSEYVELWFSAGITLVWPGYMQGTAPPQFSGTGPTTSPTPTTYNMRKRIRSNIIDVATS